VLNEIWVDIIENQNRGWGKRIYQCSNKRDHKAIYKCQKGVLLTYKGRKKVKKWDEKKPKKVENLFRQIQWREEGERRGRIKKLRGQAV